MYRLSYYIWLSSEEICMFNIHCSFHIQHLIKLITAFNIMSSIFEIYRYCINIVVLTLPKMSSSPKGHMPGLRQATSLPPSHFCPFEMHSLQPTKEKVAKNAVSAALGREREPADLQP